MGCCNPAQMLYALAKLMDTITKEGGIQMLDALWEIVQNNLTENDEWAKIAEGNMKQAWNNYLDKVYLFDLTHNIEIDTLVKFMTEAPRNTQDPIWT